jgi:hypothetical protein
MIRESEEVSSFDLDHLSLDDGNGCDDEEEIQPDFIDLIDQLESHMMSFGDQQSIVFSSEALFCAIVKVNGNIEWAAHLLLSTMELVNSKKPCRHAITGRCLLKSCSFLHDFSDFPCKFWVFSFCSSSPCLFLHDFPNQICNGIFAFPEENVDISPSHDEDPIDEAAFPPLPPSEKTSFMPSNSSKQVDNAAEALKKLSFGAASYKPPDSQNCPRTTTSSSFPVAPKVISESIRTEDYVRTGLSVSQNYAALRYF